MPVGERYDIEDASASKETTGSVGCNVIAVIGIDRYHHWPGLANAVRDAMGTAELFQRLGFEQLTEPLLDDHATGKAIQSLVTDDLMMLGPDDSLVLFYAGHGGTRKHSLGDEVIKTGYLIPNDASGSPDKVSTWIELEGWLRAVSLLPAKHILVVLDACHSGIALDPIIKWRDINSWQDTPLSTLKMRRSRRIITSALDDQVALDSGPVYGHSLFTGCLIEGLTDGIRQSGSRVTTGSELGLYLQRRVQTYPYSRQTPDFGTFAFDDRGEMVIPLVMESIPPDRQHEPVSAKPIPMPTAAPLPTAGPTPSQLPLTLLPPPMEIAKPTASTPDARRWIVIGAVGATLATALIGYLIFGHESSTVDTPRRFAAPNPPDAPSIDAASGVAVNGPTGSQSYSPRPASRGCLAGMVPVPAGTFQMGGGDTDEPQHEVILSAYCIDETEVTEKAYAACVADRGCSAALLTVRWISYSVAEAKLNNRFCNRADHPDHPINCVDWDQAKKYCTWAGKRLPTEEEWEHAARGNKDYIYPWGNEDPNATLLNGCGAECAAMAKRVLNKNIGTLYSGNDGWEATAPVGSFPGGKSEFGAFDMAGNVWEWTADLYVTGTFPAAANPRGVKPDTRRVIRGGSWFREEAGEAHAAHRDKAEPTSRIDDLGFRCARNPTGT